MKNLYSSSLELKFIKTVCNPNIPETVRTRLLSKVVTSTFAYPPCKQAYQRILQIFRTKSHLMQYYELTEDMVLETSFREILAESEAEACENKKQIDKMLDLLEKYRKARVVYETAKSAIDALRQEKIDIDGVIDTMSDSLSKARVRTSLEDDMIIMGRGSNTSAIVQEILYGDEELLLKTGFDVYDKKNGGFPKSGVVILSATTSSGKSAMLMNLMKQMHEINKIDTCRISLELTDRQEMNRFLSHISQVPLRKFKSRELTGNQKRLIEKRLKMFETESKRNKTRHVLACPVGGVSMEDILMTMKPYGFDVLGIDYISLLKGMSSERQWMIMGDAAATAKIYSRETNSLVIILAQLDEKSDSIRYSKAIKEHADVFWQWHIPTTDDEDAAARKSDTVDVNVTKDRDGERFHFPVVPKLDCMTFLNAPDAEAEDIQDDRPMNARDDEIDKMTEMRKKAGL